MQSGVLLWHLRNNRGLKTKTNKPKHQKTKDMASLGHNLPWEGRFLCKAVNGCRGMPGAQPTPHTAGREEEMVAANLEMCGQEKLEQRLSAVS